VITRQKSTLQRQTDRWTTCHDNTALCVASRGKDQKYNVKKTIVQHPVTGSGIIRWYTLKTAKNYKGDIRKQHVDNFCQRA